MLRSRKIFPNWILAGKKVKSAQSETLLTRETWYQKHEAPKCRTLGFLCVYVFSFVCLFFRPNGKKKRVVVGFRGGRGRLIWGSVFCCVFSVLFPFMFLWRNNRASFSLTFPFFFFFFLSDWSDIWGSFILKFVLFFLKKEGFYCVNLKLTCAC